MKLKLSIYVVNFLAMLLLVSCGTGSKILTNTYPSHSSCQLQPTTKSSLTNDLSIELEEDFREDDKTKDHSLDNTSPYSYSKQNILYKELTILFGTALINKAVAFKGVNFNVLLKVFRI